MTYRVAERLHVEGTDALGAPIDVELAPGEHEPRSEQEDWALRHAASLGLAEPVTPQNPARKRATKGA